MEPPPLLRQLLPAAIAWVIEQSLHIARLGVPLPQAMLAVAKDVGVARPERIRVMLVDRIPVPKDPVLRLAALRAGLLPPGAVGLTLGYGIYVKWGHQTVRLLSHECRHVFQYEVFETIDRFLAAYLEEMLTYGYAAMPLELDAQAVEVANDDLVRL